MRNRYNLMILLSVFLLLISPSPSFAWHSYDNDGYADWNYHGSGRDIPYSDDIDDYYTSRYSDYSTLGPDYMEYAPYIKNAPSPVILPVPDEFTVNIPNAHGGYTAVIIKRSGNGYIGPQGEYYPEFPAVTQLKVMYGK